METYIVRLENPNVREVLVQRFEKVGKPRAIQKTVLVHTDKLKQEIENIDGVLSVKEDVEIEFGEVQEVNNWALPRMCGSVVKSTRFGEGGEYIYNRTGKDVDVYIADTGIYLDHNEFKDLDGNKRVKTIYPDLDKVSDEDLEGNDYGSSHGTAVASCAGGKVCGVAKEINIFNVWVLYSGATVIKGLDRVLDHHLNKTNCNPSILNMSFGAKRESFLKDEMKDLVDNGIICVACAHNYDEPRSTSPARHTEVVCVGATDSDNYMSGFSNYGESVDILAPGGYINTARISNPNDITPYSNGTSFSSPYIAGILALIVQDSYVGNKEDVDRAIQILYDYSIKDKIHVKGNTPNKFSYSLVENEVISPKRHKVKTSTKGKGNVSPNIVCVEPGQNITFNIFPEEGHRLSSVEGNGGDIKENKYITTGINSDCEYTFIFEPIPEKPETPKNDDSDNDDNNILPILLAIIGSGIGVLTTYKIWDHQNEKGKLEELQSKLKQLEDLDEN